MEGKWFEGEVGAPCESQPLFFNWNVFVTGEKTIIDMDIEEKFLCGYDSVKFFFVEELKVKLWLYGNFLSTTCHLIVNKTKLGLVGFLIVVGAFFSSCSVVQQFQKNFLNDSKVDLSLRDTERPQRILDFDKFNKHVRPITK